LDTKADFGGNPRERAVGFSFDGKGFIGTGYDGATFIDRKDFWEYEPISNNWTQKEDFSGIARNSAVGYQYLVAKHILGTGLSYNAANHYWKDL
jgi:N-acetylneuraminic acid mutarotase